MKPRMFSRGSAAASASARRAAPQGPTTHHTTGVSTGVSPVCAWELQYSTTAPWRGQVPGGDDCRWAQGRNDSDTARLAQLQRLVATPQRGGANPCPVPRSRRPVPRARLPALPPRPRAAAPRSRSDGPATTDTTFEKGALPGQSEECLRISGGSARERRTAVLTASRPRAATPGAPASPAVNASSVLLERPAGVPEYPTPGGWMEPRVPSCGRRAER
jgi:hypothetical protein